MYTESRKINLLESVIKVNNEATLLELEEVLKKSKLKREKKTFSAHDFSGAWSKGDADQIKKAIEESCEQIHKDDWK